MSNTYFSNTGINVFLQAGGTNPNSNYPGYCSLHNSTGPSTTGANEVTSGSRPQTTWTVGSSSMTGSQVTINVGASTAGVDYFGIWTAASGGTYYGGGQLPASETYGEAGTYLLTPTIAGSG
jgi:hypothetical protein